jgi:peptide/nickel transport system substrate-binding protein
MTTAAHRVLLVHVLLFLVLGGWQGLPQVWGHARASAAPQSGGVLVYGRGGDSVSLDPARETDGESLNVCDNIFETLVRFKPGTTEIEPGLAESWEVSADGKEYVFKLRSGVRFHDGTPMDGAAVVFSLMRQHDPKHEAYGHSKSWDYWGDMGFGKLIKSIDAVAPDKVRFVLNHREAPFLANLAMSFAAIVSPTAVRKHKQDFARNPVGTGPFKFGSWTRGERIVLNRFDDYWGTKAHLQRVIIRSLPDSAARLNAFLAGEIQMMNLPTPDQVAAIRKARKDAQVIQKEAMNVAYLAFNTKKKPFDNVKVRQAINMAIDKKALVAGVYSGLAKEAVNPLPPTVWGYNETIKPYPFDAAKAKALLKEAGFPNGFETELYYMPVSRPYMPDGKTVATAIQANLKTIGVNVRLTTFEWAIYLEKTKNGEHPMALLGWTGDNGDPDNFLHVLLSGNNAVAPANNIAFYDNKEVTRLLEEARREVNQAKRAELYRRAQVLIHQDAPWVPLAHSVDQMPMDAKVRGFVLAPTGTRQFSSVWLQK